MSIGWTNLGGGHEDNALGLLKSDSWDAYKGEVKQAMSSILEM